VTIDLTTHEADGISQRDFDLANEINDVGGISQLDMELAKKMDQIAASMMK